MSDGNDASDTDGQASDGDPIKELAKEIAAEKTDEATDDPEPEAGDDEDAAGDEASDEEDGDEASDEDDAAEAEDDDEGEKKPKKKSRAERYRERINRLEQQNAELRSRATVPGKPTEADIAKRVNERVGDPPKEADYNGDLIAFDRAMTVYELDKVQVTREVKSEAGKADIERQHALRRKAEDHRDRQAEFAAKAPEDYAEVMKKADGLKVSPMAEELILDSDKSAHLVYYFAKHPDRLNAINAMTEREAAREIGRIESRLALPKPKTETKAPTPRQIPPGRGGAGQKTQEQRLEAYLNKKYGKRD